MKTLLSLLYTFGVTAGVVSLDSYRLDPGVLFIAVAVAALFAFALNEGRRVQRPLIAPSITRFPTRRSSRLASGANALDLAA